MNEGVFYNIFPIILKHLHPRARARCRQVCKRMCALISGSKLWGRSYAEFCKMIAHWKPEHKKLYAQGTWTLKMLNQIQRLIYIPNMVTGRSIQTLFDIQQKIQNGEDRIRHADGITDALLNNTDNWNYVRTLLEREGFYITTGWAGERQLKRHKISDEDIWNLYKHATDNFIIGLVEGLFTLSDISSGEVGMFQIFLSCAYGLEVLRHDRRILILIFGGYINDSNLIVKAFNDRAVVDDIICKRISMNSWSFNKN